MVLAMCVSCSVCDTGSMYVTGGMCHWWRVSLACVLPACVLPVVCAVCCMYVVSVVVVGPDLHWGTIYDWDWHVFHKLQAGSGIFYEQDRGSFYEWDWGSLFDRDRPVLYEQDRGTIYERDQVSFMSGIG
jgi:hypothetical protein